MWHKAVSISSLNPSSWTALRCSLFRRRVVLSFQLLQADFLKRRAITLCGRELWESSLWGLGLCPCSMPKKVLGEQLRCYMIPLIRVFLFLYSTGLAYKCVSESQLQMWRPHFFRATLALSLLLSWSEALGQMSKSRPSQKWWLALSHRADSRMPCSGPAMHSVPQKHMRDACWLSTSAGLWGVTCGVDSPLWEWPKPNESLTSRWPE